MDIFHQLLQMLTDTRGWIADAIAHYQSWTYLILFTIIFVETGLVIFPFLPGDSLLFAAGAFTGPEDPLNLIWLCLLLSAAAVLGDTVNYWIGHKIGPKIFHKENVRFLNRKHLDAAHRFYERYGGVTIILARFMPFIRTFAPFVAGIGAMTYWKFLAYNVIGGVAWIFTFVCLGHFFGNMPAVKKNFSLVIVAIVIISVMPMVIAYLRNRKRPTPPPNP